MFERLIWLAGMPRSGTTWLSQVFAAHPAVRVKFCPLFSYEFKRRCGPESTPAEWRALLRDVYATPGEFLDQVHLRREGHVPTFAQKAAAPPVMLIKSNRFHDLAPHVLAACPEVSWLAVVRHPAATIHSWLDNPTEFPSGADPRTEWRTGACRKTGPGEFWGFDDWLAVTAMQVELARRWPERVKVLRYDVARAHPLEAMAEVLEWCGLSQHEQVREFLAASRNGSSNHHRSVFKAPASAERWRTALDPRVVAQIERETCARGLGEFLEAPVEGSVFA